VRTIVWATWVAVLVLGMAPRGVAEEPTREDLERENAELRREVERLQARVAELSHRLAETELADTAFLVSTREGVVRVTPGEGTEPVRLPNGQALRGALSRSGDDIYCRSWTTVRRLDEAGTAVAMWKLAEGVVGNGFAALPGRRLAVFDNEGDRIFVVDRTGRAVRELAMRPEPDQGMQNTYGLVVGNRLLVSEDGDKRILAVDLDSYAVEVFRDFGTLRSWIGAIGNAGDTYYVCTGTEVFAFEGDAPHHLLAKLPKGNITGLVIVGGAAFLTVNFTGELLRVDLATGEVTTVADGLARPDGLVAVRR